MPSSPSSHNFSLPSRIFRSSSEANLRLVSQNSSSLYSTAAHCATESALPYIREEASSNPSTDSITALPPQDQQPRRKKSFWRLPSNLSAADKSNLLKKRAPFTTTVVASPPDTPTSPPSSKPTKTAWGIIIGKFKSPFARLKKLRSPKRKPKRKPILISSPSDFQHLGSGSGMPLRRGDGQVTFGGQQHHGDEQQGRRMVESEWEDVED